MGAEFAGAKYIGGVEEAGDIAEKAVLDVFDMIG